MERKNLWIMKVDLLMHTNVPVILSGMSSFEVYLGRFKMHGYVEVEVFMQIGICFWISSKVWSL